MLFFLPQQHQPMHGIEQTTAHSAILLNVSFIRCSHGEAQQFRSSLTMQAIMQCSQPGSYINVCWPGGLNFPLWEYSPTLTVGEQIDINSQAQSKEAVNSPKNGGWGWREMANLVESLYRAIAQKMDNLLFHSQIYPLFWLTAHA